MATDPGGGGSEGLGAVKSLSLSSMSAVTARRIVSREGVVVEVVVAGVVVVVVAMIGRSSDFFVTSSFSRTLVAKRLFAVNVAE